MRRLTPQALEGEIDRPIKVMPDDLPGLREDRVVSCMRRTLSKCGFVSFYLPDLPAGALADIAAMVGDPLDGASLTTFRDETTQDTLRLLADPIWQPSPPEFALLAAGEGATGHGGVISVSRVAAYEALSPAMRHYLAGLEAVHDAALPLADACETPERLRWLASLRERNPPKRSALSVQLAENGATALGVSPAFTRAIHGVPGEEGRVVLDYLKTLFEAPEAQRRMEWDDGLVLLWKPSAALLFPFGDDGVSFPVSYAALKGKDIPG
ncbi:alpha-ketoglutarate-dependent taurine dioxygenase [Parvibaculum indicum]|uniref:TauD/TfdA dioxygenase family protein n=1 Tax=Parvibaculum indicum TaxID=562969 RepID=UPI001422FD79|nr:TauD/TfdA family dioxygenase [Parvibaculum indicum]NIJ43029.1 alpha-ketoglutarate-dependent taurine dioxygenase [Parvibaculum indicum]